MRARHRLSKLLLRHGIVYYGGKPWTANHDRWLGVQRRQAVFALPGLGLAFDTAYDTVLATLARRDRLDAAIAALAADSGRRDHNGRRRAGRAVEDAPNTVKPYSQFGLVLHQARQIAT